MPEKLDVLSNLKTGDDGVPVSLCLQVPQDAQRLISQWRAAITEELGNGGSQRSHRFRISLGRQRRRPFAPEACLEGDPFVRPVGAPPYTAYRYRTAPSARIIQLPDR